MVIGRRRDVSVVNRSLYLPENVDHVAALEGKLHSPYGIDYFAIAGNRYPWHVVPDLVVGRPVYDNFLVSTASLYNLAVVDATLSVVALHQTDSEGLVSGRRCSDSNYNQNIIRRRFHGGCWHTDCTKYQTRVAATNDSFAKSYRLKWQKGRSVVIAERSNRKK